MHGSRALSQDNPVGLRSSVKPSTCKIGLETHEEGVYLDQHHDTPKSPPKNVPTNLRFDGPDFTMFHSWIIVVCTKVGAAGFPRYFSDRHSRPSLSLKVPGMCRNPRAGN